MDVTGGVLGGCCQVSDTLQRFEARMFEAWTSLEHDGTSKVGRQMKLHIRTCLGTASVQGCGNPILFSLLKTGILYYLDNINDMW